MTYSEHLNKVSQSILNFNQSLHDNLQEIIQSKSIANISIYRKNLFFGAFNNLTTDYVGLRSHLGNNNFKFLVRKYLLESKIKSPNIFDFSKYFSIFLLNTFDFHKDDLLTHLARLDLLYQYGEVNKSQTIRVTTGVFAYWSGLINKVDNLSPQIDKNSQEEVIVFDDNGERCLKLKARTYVL